MTVFAYICSYSILIPAILAGIFFNRSQFKAFNLLIIVCALAEILLTVLALNGINNWNVIYIFLLIELLLAGYVFAQVVLLPRQRSWFLVVTAGCFVIGVCLFIMKQFSLLHYIQNITLMILAGSALYLIIAESNTERIWDYSNIWIALSLFLNFFCNSIVSILIEPLINNEQEGLGAVFNILLGIVNITTYFGCSVAILKGR